VSIDSIAPFYTADLPSLPLSMKVKSMEDAIKCKRWRAASIGLIFHLSFNKKKRRKQEKKKEKKKCVTSIKLET